jgi:hypothetical protein
MRTPRGLQYPGRRMDYRNAAGLRAEEDIDNAIRMLQEDKW